MIWWKEALMAAVGLCSGLAVAGGLFALIIALGLVAKFADQTHTARTQWRQAVSWEIW